MMNLRAFSRLNNPINSKSRATLAILNSNIWRSLISISFLVIVLSACRPALAINDIFLSSALGNSSRSKLHLSNDYLSVFKIGQVLSSNDVKIEDWLKLLSDVELDLIDEKGVQIDYLYLNQQGYQDQDWSIALFEARNSNYFISEGAVHFSHGLETALHNNWESQNKYAVSYQSETVHREGIKINISKEVFWGIQTNLVLKY